MIDIIIPVLNRPQNAQKVVDSIHASTEVEHTILFVCSPEDPDEEIACVETGAPHVAVDWQPGPGDGAKKWNYGYTLGTAPFVFLAADDLEFTPGWDTIALTHADISGAGVIGTNDAMNPLVKRGRHSTHSLVRRSYIDEIGGTFFDGPKIVYHEGYDHQAVDTELCKAAMDRGQWAFARRSVVIHHHPFYDKTVRRDSTYDKALREGSSDMRLYKERLARWSREQRTR